MNRVSPTSRRIGGALACALLLSTALPAPAEVFHSEPTRHRTLFVPRDKSLPFHLDGVATKIVVAQPDTAAIIPTGGDTFYVQGKEVGETNLLVYGPGGRLAEVIDVRVGYDPRVLEDELSAVFPNESIQVSSLGPNLLLSGDVSNTGVATRAAALAEKYAPGAWTSNLTARASQEVILEVRVLEADRNLLHDLGINLNIHNNSFQFASGNGLIGADVPQGVLNLFGMSGHTTIDATLQALEQKGVVRTLARPNLVAISGEKASFLAGGEFPYPVPQTGNGGSTTITIEFRKYGVRLDFRPIVQDNGLIRLEVEPEVSKLDPTNSVRVNGFSVPGLITRNTHTTVELHDGASLAIGGLYERDYQNNVDQVPGLGEIPVLSALFRSARWQRNETELVIIVTPRLATAEDFARAKAQTALAGEESGGAQLMLLGRSLDKPMSDGSGPPGSLDVNGQPAPQKPWWRP
jgi:pilus assembly protein CpaC